MDYGIWTFGKFRNRRGGLTEEARHFEVNVELGARHNVIFRLSNDQPKRIRGLSDTSGNEIVLIDNYIVSESGSINAAGRRSSRLKIHSYTKLESEHQIRQFRFSRLEVELPHFNKNIDLTSLFLAEGISSKNFRDKTFEYYSGDKFKIALQFAARAKGNGREFKFWSQPKLTISFNKPQNLERIVGYFDLVRNIIALCSYFKYAINLDDAELYYNSTLGLKREQKIKLTVKNIRRLKPLGNNGIAARLVDPLFQDPSLFENYRTFLQDKKFQYVLDVYLSHYVLGKNSEDVTIEAQFLNAVQLMEATYERIHEDIAHEAKRKVRGFSCTQCGNTNYCKNCSKLQFKNLQSKLQDLVRGALRESIFEDLPFAYQKISDTRNYYIHGRRNAERPLLDHRGMIEASNKMEFVFLYVLLRGIGYDLKIIDDILPHISPFNETRDINRIASEVRS